MPEAIVICVHRRVSQVSQYTPIISLFIRTDHLDPCLPELKL